MSHLYSSPTRFPDVVRSVTNMLARGGSAWLVVIASLALSVIGVLAQQDQPVAQWCQRVTQLMAELGQEFGLPVLAVLQLGGNALPLGLGWQRR